MKTKARIEVAEKLPSDSGATTAPCTERAELRTGSEGTTYWVACFAKEHTATASGPRRTDSGDLPSCAADVGNFSCRGHPCSCCCNPFGVVVLQDWTACL